MVLAEVCAAVPNCYCPLWLIYRKAQLSLNLDYALTETKTLTEQSYKIRID